MLATGMRSANHQTSRSPGRASPRIEGGISRLTGMVISEPCRSYFMIQCKHSVESHTGLLTFSLRALVASRGCNTSWIFLTTHYGFPHPSLCGNVFRTHGLVRSFVINVAAHSSSLVRGRKNISGLGLKVTLDCRSAKTRSTPWGKTSRFVYIYGVTITLCTTHRLKSLMRNCKC
jgi:hypothetical protein